MQLPRPARPPGPRQPNRLAKRAAAVGQGAAAGRRGEPARQRWYTPAAAPHFTAARERRLRADHDVEEVLAIVSNFPQLPVVIDHCLYLTAKDPTTTQHTLQKLLRLAK